MLNFYEIDGRYIDYLRKFDNKIPYIDSNQYKTYKNTKFFCGVVLSINGMCYYAPVSSYNKTNVTTFGIFDKQTIDPNTNKPKQISSLRLGFMFPCPVNYLSTKRFSNETYQNKIFLQKELFFLNNKIADVYKKAEKVYKLGTKTYTRNLYNICNFPLLEEKCKEWEEVQNILSTLKHIKQEDDLFYIYDNLINKNKFDRVVKMIDNNFSTFNKDIKLLDIKDLENKRFVSIEELATTIDLKAKSLNIKSNMDIEDYLELIKNELPSMKETKDCFDGVKITKPFTESEINNIKDYFIKYFRLDGEAISEDTEETTEDVDENNLKEGVDENNLKEGVEEKGKQKEIQEKLDDILDYIKNKAVEDVSELSDKTKADDMMSLVVSSELDKFRLATSLKLEDVAVAISISNTNTLSEDELWKEIKDELYNKAIVELKGEIKEDLELENNNQNNLNQTSEEDDKVKDDEKDEEEE